MSSIVEFFIAPGDDAAAAVADHGLDGVNEVARYGNFDPVTTTGEWESSFGIVRDDGPRSAWFQRTSISLAASGRSFMVPARIQGTSLMPIRSPWRPCMAAR